MFNILESELRRIQKTSTPEDLATKVWLFKIKTRSGGDYDGWIYLAEIIALLEVMDEYKPVPTQ